MDWIKTFYTQKSQWLAALGKPTGILPHDYVRVQWIQQFCGQHTQIILELGCGDGETALACAQAGHRVTAVELSPFRIARARDLAQHAPPDTLTLLEGDFYQMAFPSRFGLICYWDGFGVGTDQDQQRLLTKMEQDWLTPEGSVILEVFNPWYWIRQTGVQRRFASLGITVEYRFDPLQSRFSEHCISDDPTIPPIAQTIRCYTPSDLHLLLHGTGLRFDQGTMHGIDFHTNSSLPLADPLHAWWTHETYVVKLVRSI